MYLSTCPTLVQAQWLAMQMNNYWEMGSSKGPIIALQFSYYHNTPIPYCHTLLLLILAHKNSYYWTLMCPIFAQKHLGSCKWNNNLGCMVWNSKVLGCKVWNGMVLGCMIKYGNKVVFCAMRCVVKCAQLWGVIGKWWTKIASISCRP